MPFKGKYKISSWPSLEIHMHSNYMLTHTVTEDQTKCVYLMREPFWTPVETSVGTGFQICQKLHKTRFLHLQAACVHCSPLIIIAITIIIIIHIVVRMNTNRQNSNLYFVRTIIIIIIITIMPPSKIPLLQNPTTGSRNLIQDLHQRHGTYVKHQLWEVHNNYGIWFIVDMAPA